MCVDGVVTREKVGDTYVLSITNNEKITSIENIVTCKKCNNSTMEYNKPFSMFICSSCKSPIDIELSDKLIHYIYLNYGFETLKSLTDMSDHGLQKAIGRHFKRCCIKKENCVYEKELLG